MSSDRFTCASLESLFKWVAEYERGGEFLGISRDLFHTPESGDGLALERYGQVLETPLGVAAGPHTQLSQNIISAWLTGSRYMELKTVQVLDELEVTKPCIDMADEGYNCEWSQELKLDQSFDEYLNAWIMLHVLRDRFGFQGDDCGFIFNMSVGYNLEGIMHPSVQRFLDRMGDCSTELAAKVEEIAAFYPRIRELKIPSCISRNVTISTMHGCPPEETEKIGRYFVEERRFDTTIKLNPTLLGPERLRHILNEKLGFDTVVPDLAFEHDLEYEAGVALIRSLRESADRVGTTFNLKLTNTLETSNRQQNLPDSEPMVYMSGRALHPISVNLAARLQREFGGELDVSFSGGVDCFNFADTLACGLMPVTVCSDILKPGGYGRLGQYLINLKERMVQLGAGSLHDLILKTAGKTDRAEAQLANLERYAAEVLEAPAYKKAEHPYDSIKTDRELGFFDCAAAPCMSECPAGQEIPRYLNYVATGDLQKAYQTVLATNPFPNVQGMVCDHACQSKCTRINYEKPVLIREIKRYIADRFQRDLPRPEKTNGVKVSIIGGGPSGLSCAHFLALNGYEVELYEAKDILGGMAADGIPVFRLDDGRLQKDIDGILKLGVTVHRDTPVTRELFEQIRERSDYVYVAVGAQKSLRLEIPGIDSDGVYDQLTYLSRVRKQETLPEARNIIVIGAGNSAMDAARTARRVVGEGGSVSIVYRRTRREMPCDPEEVRGALEEGIRIVELASPEAVLTDDRGHACGLEVSRMQLGEADASGRARPVKIPDSRHTIAADLIIPAIGQKVDLEFFPREALVIEPATGETDIPNVFAGGDATRGASSLINAIADGQRVAAAIVERADREHLLFHSPEDRRDLDLKRLRAIQARRDAGPGLPEVPADARINFDLFMETLSDEDAQTEAARCLQCDLVCNVCTTVCPNRSNLAYEMGAVELPVQRATVVDGAVRIHTEATVKLEQQYQILNIGDYCNECGNCTTFCPTAGQPWQDKPKFHITTESFRNAEHGFHFSAPGVMEIKEAGGTSELREVEDGYLYRGPDFEAHLAGDTLEAREVIFPANGSRGADLRRVAEFVILYRNVHSLAPFAPLEI